MFNIIHHIASRKWNGYGIRIFHMENLPYYKVIRVMENLLL